MTDDTAEPIDPVATCRRQRAELAQLRAELDAARIEITTLRTLRATSERMLNDIDAAWMRVRREP